MDKTPHFHCKEAGLLSGWGAKILHATWYDKNIKLTGFPDGSALKNLPANTGDTGLIPDPGCPCSATREDTAMRSLQTATEEWPSLATNRGEPVQPRRPSTAKSK